MRYANRRDGNEGDIVEYLEACGYQLKPAQPPAPFDWFVRRGSNPMVVFLELKTKLGKLTRNQATFKEWVGEGPYISARTPEEALTKLQAWI